MTEYFGEYSSTAKSFLITSSHNEVFKEYAGFCTHRILLQSNPTAVTKVRGSLIIAGWENRNLNWAALTSVVGWENRNLNWAALTLVALIREATASRKNRATALAYWLGMFYTPPPGKERPSSRQKDPVGLPTPEEELTGRQRELAKAKALVLVPAERVCDPAKGKWLEVVKPRKKPVEL
jgi:hypothetical protein